MSTKEHKTAYIFLSIAFLLMVSCSGRNTPNSLIDYRRSGGIVGLDDHLVILENGQATLTRDGEDQEFVIDKQTMVELNKLFAEADFKNLNSKYLPNNNSTDILKYSLVYEGKKVEALDTAVPNKLWPIIESLNKIINDT